MENTNLYTQEEQELLDYSRQVRLTMVKDMTKGGTPSYKEVEVVNQVLTSLDKSVHDSVSNRVKLQDSSNKAEILAAVAETIKQARLEQIKAKEAAIEAETDLGEEYIPVDLVPGEQEMDQKQFTLEELTVEEE